MDPVLCIILAVPVLLLAFLIFKVIVPCGNKNASQQAMPKDDRTQISEPTMRHEKIKEIQEQLGESAKRGTRASSLHFLCFVLLIQGIALLGQAALAFEQIEYGSQYLVHDNFQKTFLTGWSGQLKAVTYILSIILIICAVQRLHDIGRRGWWLLIMWILCAIIIVYTRILYSDGILPPWLFLAFDGSGVLFAAYCALGVIPPQPFSNKWGDYRSDWIKYVSRKNTIALCSVAIVSALAINGLSMGYIYHCLEDRVAEIKTFMNP